MSKHLIDEPPLLVSPSLAEAIGLNEAIFLQQLHFWLTPSKKYKPHYQEWEGKVLPWIYNTYKKQGETGWEANFPFWSARTIMRIVISLRKKNLIITTDKFNKMITDRTLWYTINYDEVEKIENAEGDKLALSTVTDGQSHEGDNLADSRECQNGNLLPETTAQTIPETTEGGGQKTPPAPSRDPAFLPDSETQLDLLFPQNGRGVEGQLQALERSGWNVRGDDIRNALAHFLKASNLPIPNDASTRNGWIKSIRQHVNNFGVPLLAKAYPVAIDCTKHLTIGRPGALDNTLPAVVRDLKNGGSHARSTSPELDARSQAISAAIKARARSASPG